MYKVNKRVQFNECLICSQILLKNMNILDFLYPIPICETCIRQFGFINKTIQFYHYPLHILYIYNDFFKALLYQYKGVYDYALKDVFLCLYKNELKERYKNYIVVVAPSSKEDNHRRGFAPMEEIAKTIFLHVFNGIYKLSKYKQSDYSFEERKKVKDKMSIMNKQMLKGKNVLILDDVLTSGSTLKTCLDLVLQCHPKKVELMVLSTHQNLEELEERFKN